MASQCISAKFSLLPRILSPLTTAIFSTLPLWQRWRLLLLQPVNILAALLTAPTWLFSNRYEVIHAPTRSGTRRCLVFLPPRGAASSTEERIGRKNEHDEEARLRPLHIEIHGGGWIGGFPEQSARFCAHLSSQTGAVVVSISYRIAPRHIYPAAHDDVDDVVAWLVTHARDFGADAKLLTIGGGSVGAGLGLSACQHLDVLRHRRKDGGGVESGIAKPLAWIGICPALDFRVAPKDKPKPANMPTSDPVAFLLPMFDVYAGTERKTHLEDKRLHPILVDEKALPADLLVIAAGIDVLLAEALEFAERLRRERNDRGVELMVVDKGFHGFVELPSFILEKERLEVFVKAVTFLQTAHRKAGFHSSSTKHL